MPLHQYDIRNVRIVIANFIFLLFTYKNKKRGRMNKNEFFRQLGLIRTQDVEKKKLEIDLRREEAGKEANINQRAFCNYVTFRGFQNFIVQEVTLSQICKVTTPYTYKIQVLFRVGSVVGSGEISLLHRSSGRTLYLKTLLLNSRVCRNKIISQNVLNVILKKNCPLHKLYIEPHRI